MTLSIVVAAHDSQSRLDGLLECLRAQTLPRERWELIVVDDGSSVPLSAGIAGRTIRIDQAGGAYAARNIGLREAAGDLVAITDADCRPRPDWLRSLVAALDTADMAGGAIRITTTEAPGITERIDAERNLDQESYVGTGFAAFANFACRRKVLDTVGPFNDRLVSNGDREFCMRATAAGFSLTYAPDAVVEHAALRGVGALASRSFRLGRGRAQTMRLGAGPARSANRNWHSPASYHRVGAAHLFVGVPLVAGYALGALEARLGSGRRAGSGRPAALPESA